MARVCWTDKAEESILGIGRYIIEQTQSRQRGLDVITRIEEKCALYAKFPGGGNRARTLGRACDASESISSSSSIAPSTMGSWSC